MATVRKQASAKPQRQRVEEEAKKYSIFDMMNLSSRVPVKDLDKQDKLIYRWTRTAGKRAGEQGKFVIVGIKPKKASKSLAPSLTSAGKVKNIMVEGLDETDRFNTDNIIVTTLNVLGLAKSFPEYYLYDLEESVEMPIYIVGTLTAVTEQLFIQNIFPADKRLDDAVFNKFSNWLWDATGVHHVENFVAWSKTPEFLAMIALNPTAKKAEEIANVNPEDVYKILALAKFMGHHGSVKVLDVNNVDICIYGQAPKKNVRNVFSDAVISAHFKDVDPNATFSLDRKVFNISGLANTMYPKMTTKNDPSVDKEGKKKDNEGIAHSTKDFKVEGLDPLVFRYNVDNVKFTVDLSQKIYSDNAAAVKILFAEIDAVNKGDIGYKYAEPKGDKVRLVTQFSSKLADLATLKYAGKVAKGDKVERVKLPENVEGEELNEED